MRDKKGEGRKGGGEREERKERGEERGRKGRKEKGSHSATRTRRVEAIWNLYMAKYSNVHHYCIP